ncbi:hypothetical protein [Aureibacter tunicatorum]|uniref:Uncharacterized protein n=1 Tax=Aureibacter tunicatorum TaxID=866807 RepID=A0AAE3XKG6_9BACT|nr:hypothetical protein [Aureibacter tunicatorum]MDR6238278.1 hypothetical protein [Aureibacter tunicatorum]BDD03311.1 hypothetical protein AUTU_07940 [Aureibacter tunicatorum]
MKYFSYLLLCVLSGISMLLNAQEKLDVKVHQGRTFDSKEQLRHVIGEDKTGVYYIKQEGVAKYFLAKASKDLIEEKVELFNKGSFLNQMSFTAYHIEGNNVFVIASVTDMKKQTIEAKLLRFDKFSLKLIEEKVLSSLSLSSFKGKKKKKKSQDDQESDKYVTFTMHNTAPQIKILARMMDIYSPDKSKLMITQFLDNNKKIRTFIYDRNLNKIGERDFFVEDSQKTILVFDQKLDNNGDVYQLFAIRGKYIVNRYMENGEVKKYEFETSENILIQDIKLKVTSEGVVCAGIYDLKTEKSQVKRNKNLIGVAAPYYRPINGAFSVKFDKKSGELLYKTFHAFDTEMMVKGETEERVRFLRSKVEEGDELEMYNYALDRLVIHENGGVSIIAEQFYITEYMKPGASDPTYYKFLDIIAVNFNEDGSFNWSQLIPKSQKLDRSYIYSSFAMMNKNNKLYFFFNDNPRNTLEANTKMPKDIRDPRKMVVSKVTVDDKGNISKNLLFEDKDETGVVFKPVMEFESQRGELILYGEWRGTQCFYRLTSNE